ncbi:hypothetical protein [Comamonas odontotermitis]|uniref:hypothetical protein n=1 Tax=Comamonas odontotermitis TaxID=379895 RepID=UPI001CC80314|nr:hypothetical protein [Comamonas odontotermitis]UBB18360.1 hypothetical protein LAD35_06905 [Comamonas odontotermitis]
MSYVLATTQSKVKWYKFSFGQSKPGEQELVDVLDLDVVPIFGDKQTAKLAAQSIGLKTWRYVKI